MLILTDPKTETAKCGVCGSIVFRKDEDCWAATQRHIETGCK